MAQAYVNPDVDNSLECFSWAIPNFVAIRDFVGEKFGWPRGKIDEIIKPVIKKFDVKISQTRIDNYFLTERVSLPAKGQLQESKRVQNAIEKVLGRKIDNDNVKKTKPKTKTVAKPTEKKTEQEPKPSTSKAPQPVQPILNTKELEEKAKMEAKQKAIEIYKKTQENKKGKKKSKLKQPKRIVLSQHHLSDSDSN